MILQYMYYSSIKLFIHQSIFPSIHHMFIILFHIIIHLLTHFPIISISSYLVILMFLCSVAVCQFFSLIIRQLTHQYLYSCLSIYLSIGAVCIVFLLIQRQLTLDYLSIYLYISDLIGFLYLFYASIKAIESSDAKDER